uniref:Uncharacterized protein n=1 Tax=Panagrolaimus sp. JU765 TaxID=591449 RepID=A0AC34Q5X5_9BILA
MIKYQLNLCRIYVSYFGPQYVKLLPLISPIVGGSIFVVILVDLTNVLTIHMRCFHLYSKLLFKLFSSGIRSSYYAFMGKKYNPLRNRVDEADIGFDHRLFATFVFLLLVFLMPTMVVFCLVFSGLFIIVQSVTEGLIFLTKLYVDSLTKIFADN